MSRTVHGGIQELQRPKNTVLSAEAGIETMGVIPVSLAPCLRRGTDKPTLQVSCPTGNVTDEIVRESIEKQDVIKPDDNFNVSDGC